MFLLACRVWEGLAKVETEVGVQVEAGAGSELNAPFYASSLLLAPPLSLAALARDDDDCFADNDKAGVGRVCAGKGRGQSLSSLPDCLALPRILT